MNTFKYLYTGRKWIIGCGDDASNTIRMEKLEEAIGDSVRLKNISLRVKGKYIQDSCKTSNDVRCRDLGSTESTRGEVGCGGNDEWSHQAGQN